LVSPILEKSLSGRTIGGNEDEQLDVAGHRWSTFFAKEKNGFVAEFFRTKKNWKMTNLFMKMRQFAALESFVEQIPPQKPTAFSPVRLFSNIPQPRAQA